MKNFIFTIIIYILIEIIYKIFNNKYVWIYNIGDNNKHNNYLIKNVLVNIFKILEYNLDNPHKS